MDKILASILDQLKTKRKAEDAPFKVKGDGRIRHAKTEQCPLEYVAGVPAKNCGAAAQKLALADDNEGIHQLGWTFIDAADGRPSLWYTYSPIDWTLRDEILKACGLTLNPPHAPLDV